MKTYGYILMNDGRTVDCAEAKSHGLLGAIRKARRLMRERNCNHVDIYCYSGYDCGHCYVASVGGCRSAKRHLFNNLFRKG